MKKKKEPIKLLEFWTKDDVKFEVVKKNAKHK